MHARTTGGEPSEDTSLRAGKAILVADDKEIVRKTLGRMLESLGYRPTLASSGIDAVDSYRKAGRSDGSIDAVILGLGPPGGTNGLAILAMLKDLDPRVKVIAASAYLNDPVVTEYAKHGFSAVLAKPFGLEDLKRVLTEVFGG